MFEEIVVKRAAQHNLKNLDIRLPRNRLIVMTGPSGSGKSSLAFDTLFAEGQRRYIECLSTYARQYIEQMEKPNVESIEGLSPSISIEQKTIPSNPRSTVGTVTEIYDFLRLLFARAGTPHCPRCGRRVSSLTAQQILTRLLEGFSGQKVQILSPVIQGRKGDYQSLLERFQRKGFLRARIDGRFQELEEGIRLERSQRHNIEIWVDEVEVSHNSRQRLKEAVDKAMEISQGNLVVVEPEGKETFYSSSLICPVCEISLPELEPRTFSFNSPYGACPYCHGLGVLSTWSKGRRRFRNEAVCPQCGGSRLKKAALSVKIGEKDISQLSSLPAAALLEELSRLKFPSTKKMIGTRIVKEIQSRLNIMMELAMPYLQISRSSSSLSGGEARRVRLAAQVGARLRGILYVLDEPTIGLHQRDNTRLVSLLREIRDEGNSIIVVEHDEQTIRAADYILDLGPGAGEKGGSSVAEGDLRTILSSPSSLTSQYLRGEKCIPIPERRRKSREWITVKEASEFNLKNIDVRFPLSVFTVVTGVSGSGKSTLVYDILYKALCNTFYKAQKSPGQHRRIVGAEKLTKVVSVDQKPIGRTPRSNPATYTGVFTSLRHLFAMTRQSRMKGYSPSRFSFNLSGGRCEECRGAGSKKIEMHFLPDVFVTCDRCGGQRYNKETLSVRYKGKNIADYLNMTVDEAYDYLKTHPHLKRKLEIMKRVGLGYLKLGQPAPTLSGGEAQRIKLTKELGRKNAGQTLYLLDEPTTGLHFDDVRQLLEVLSALVNLGNTVMVIEHNLEVIKYADHIVDLGPEGGEKGGWVVAQGTPEEVTQVRKSYTGQYLKKVLYKKERKGAEKFSL
ncbi:excinuclease ABC subunit UvrA [bacterium]|nr:excinuclease ABC subunit UvrA [bacterium]